jgi:AbiU2
MNNEQPYELLGTPPDHKNIGLAKTLLSLRADLDIHCLIRVNLAEIRARAGFLFWSEVAKLALDSIVLEICKIYEPEPPEKARYELNSIQGVLNSLARAKHTSDIDRSKVHEFVSRYGGPTHEPDLIKALQLTFDTVRERYTDELERFKTARDKVIAHSEYLVQVESVPSFGKMESLFEFGADFYDVVGECFIGYSVDELKNRREVKRSFEKVLRLIGLEHIETEMK